MIVESTTPRLIGEELILPQFEYGPAGTTKARIVRQATEQEYIDDCLADPTLPDSNRDLMVLTNDPNLRWYEVATD